MVQEKLDDASVCAPRRNILSDTQARTRHRFASLVHARTLHKDMGGSRKEDKRAQGRGMPSMGREGR